MTIPQIEDPLNKPVRELIALMASNELTPAELTNSVLRNAQDQKSLGAFLTINEQYALRRASESRERYLSGCQRPLEGVPFALKDVEPTKGIRTTFGSALYKDYVPAEDGAVAALTKQRGAVLVGKTNTSSFAHLDDTVNPLGVSARNPVDPTYSPGGSSGGAAAAVASGVLRIAHATDGAGSARLPAALCGVVGFKPTYGVIPRWPVEDAWAARSHHGIIGRTVDDVAMGMAGLAEFDARDPLSLELNLDWTDLWRLPLGRPPRVGYIRSWSPGETVAPEVEAVVDEGLLRLERAGWVIEEVQYQGVSVPDLFDMIYSPQFARDMAANGIGPDQAEDTMAHPMRLGAAMTLDEYMNARRDRGLLNLDAVRLLNKLDFLVSAGAPRLPWKVDGDVTGLLSGQSDRLSVRLESLAVYNLLGWPAVTVPCGESHEGLPVGLQISGIRGSDGSVLRAAYAAEACFRREVPGRV